MSAPLVLDDGLQFGLGVFETIAVEGGHGVLLQAHLARLARSAAALAYYLVLTLFPLVMCVNYLIGLFHFDLEQVLQAAGALLPVGVTGVLGDYLAYVAGVRSPALLWASVFTILISASAGLRTLFLALDELYEVRRPMGIKATLLSVVLSALFLVTIYFSVVVIFTGDWFFRLLEQHLPRPLKQLISHRLPLSPIL